MENYKQKYEQALKQAKRELEACGSLDCDAARQIFRLFPDLRKSEDELIREELIHFLETCRDTRFVGNRKRDKWISWLDKLIIKHEDNKCTCDNEILVGYDCTSVDLSKFCDEIQEFSDMLEDKPKPYWDGWYEAMEWIRTHGNPFEKEDKSTNKEPKFKVGDWVVDGHDQIYQVGQIVKVERLDDETWGYTLEDGTYFSGCFEEQFHLWTIQDTKDGDVIEFADHGRIVIGIVSHVNKVTGKVDVNCLLDGNNFKLGIYYALDTIKPHPATKEQCDLLFQKIEEAGYKWDVEKKKLKKIEQNLC